MVQETQWEQAERHRALDDESARAKDIKSLRDSITANTFKIDDAQDEIWEQAFAFAGKGFSMLAGTNPHSKAAMQTLGFLGMTFTTAVLGLKKGKALGLLHADIETAEKELVKMGQNSSKDASPAIKAFGS